MERTRAVKYSAGGSSCLTDSQEIPYWKESNHTFQSKFLFNIASIKPIKLSSYQDAEERHAQRVEVSKIVYENLKLEITNPISQSSICKKLIPNLTNKIQIFRITWCLQCRTNFLLNLFLQDNDHLIWISRYFLQFKMYLKL